MMALSATCAMRIMTLIDITLLWITDSASVSKPPSPDSGGNPHIVYKSSNGLMYAWR